MAIDPAHMSAKISSVPSQLASASTQLAATKAAVAQDPDCSPAVNDGAPEHAQVQTAMHASGYTVCAVCSKWEPASIILQYAGQGTRTIKGNPCTCG